MTKLRSTKIVNFMTPGRGDPLPGRGHKGHDGKYIIPLKIFKIVTFITPGTGVFIKRVLLYKSFSENALFLEKSSSLLPGIHQTSYL